MWYGTFVMNFMFVIISDTKISTPFYVMFQIISPEVVQNSVFSEALYYAVTVVLVIVDVALPENS